MLELLIEFITTLTETAIGLTELGLIFGAGALFFKGLSWIGEKAKTLAS